MRPSTSLGLNVLSSICASVTPVLLSREVRVKPGPVRQEAGPGRSGPIGSRSALVAARLYDAFDFVAHGSFEQCRKMLVHPFADQRLDRREEIHLVAFHPLI